MFDQIKGIWKNINQVVVFGTAFGVAATVSFVLYRHYYLQKKLKVKQISSELLKSNNRIIPSQSAQQTRNRVINQIKKFIPDQEDIKFQAVKAIYQAQFQLSRVESQELIRHNRRDRRTALNDLKNYLDHVSNYQQNLQEIYKYHLNTILSQFNIDKSTWTDLIDEASVQNKQEWDQFLAKVQQKQLQFQISKQDRTLGIAKLKQILEFKAGKLADRLQEFKETFKMIEPSTLFVIIGLWADDIVYQKFKLQAEDMNWSIQKLKPDQKLQIKQIQNKVNNLIESLVIANDTIQF